MWPGVIVVVVEHGVGAGERGLGSGQDQGGVQVALHDEICSHAPPGVGDRRPPVEAQHPGAGGVHRFEEMIAADAEVDSRSIGMTGGECGEHCGRMW